MDKICNYDTRLVFINYFWQGSGLITVFLNVSSILPDTISVTIWLFLLYQPLKTISRHHTVQKQILAQDDRNKNRKVVIVTDILLLDITEEFRLCKLSTTTVHLLTSENHIIFIASNVLLYFGIKSKQKKVFTWLLKPVQQQNNKTHSQFSKS